MIRRKLSRLFVSYEQVPRTSVLYKIQELDLTYSMQVNLLAKSESRMQL